MTQKREQMLPFLTYFQIDTEMSFQIVENMPEAIFRFESLF